MERIFVDLAATHGPVKPMHAVNNGPIRSMSVQCRQNFSEWVEAAVWQMPLWWGGTPCAATNPD